MGRKDEFRPKFEGPPVLEELLALAGARVDVDGAIEVMRAAIAQGSAPSEVFPALFEGEPRFPDPRIARRLFENLFGLWEALRAGRPLQANAAPRAKKEKPPPPGRWGEAGPDPEWVAKAARHLEADVRARERLWHGFENRQDALLGWLDAQDLPDEGYGVLRLLLSELSSMIELGSEAPLLSADPGAAEGEEAVPAALWAYAEEALSKAGQDEEAPLAPGELETVRRLARRGLWALYRARKA